MSEFLQSQDSLSLKYIPILSNFVQKKKSSITQLPVKGYRNY